MNPFQDTYERRLKIWRDLRLRTETLPVDQACVQIDRWWQQAPLVKNYLHWNDTQNWPGPWDLLSENTYCTLARSLGMCYNLLMIGVDDVQLVAATDSQCEEHHLVLVDGAKYILNFWPNTVLSTTLSDFTIQRSIPIDSIINKIK